MPNEYGILVIKDLEKSCADAISQKPITPTETFDTFEEAVSFPNPNDPDVILVNFLKKSPDGTWRALTPDEFMSKS